MKIIKYKKMTNGKYKLTLDNNENIELYEDTILKFELLLTKEIKSSNKNDIILFNNSCEVYYVSLKSLKTRFKSTNDLREALKRKDYNSTDIENAIEKLTKQGYLNDDSFSKAFINNQMLTSNKGPNKIKKELLNKGISNEDIDNNIVLFNEELQSEKVNKLINKAIKSNRTRGGVILKRKIINDLINLGYDSYIITRELSNYNFNDNGDIYKREYDKLYKRLSRKYSGNELEYMIKKKLYQKGLTNNE